MDYLFIFVSCGLNIQEIFLYMKWNDFSIRNCKINIVKLLIDIRVQKKLRYFSWCPVYVVCELKCYFSQGWKCLFFCCEVWTGLGSANTFLSRISFGAYVGNDMQLLNPLSTNSSLNVEVEMVVFNQGTMCCVTHINLLRIIIQFEWQWLDRILCNYKT